MKLILMRHGHDIGAGDQENRLSKRGAAEVATLARLMAGQGIKEIDCVRSSPLNRAQQTASSLSGELLFHEQRADNRLQPGEESLALESLLLECVESYPDVCLFVGHEPQLSNALLTWCGLPANDSADNVQPPWVLSRGEAVVIYPQINSNEVTVDYKDAEFFGSPRPLPLAATS